MTTHREAKEVIDGLCVDCEYIYGCGIKEDAEERGNHITECSRFKEDTELIHT